MQQMNNHVSKPDVYETRRKKRATSLRTVGVTAMVAMALCGGTSAMAAASEGTPATGIQVQPAAATESVGSVVRIDEHKRLIVNGEPFFPLGFYGGATGEEDLARIASAGYNTVLSYQYGADKDPRGFLDRAQKHGVWVIYSLKDFWQDGRFPEEEYATGADYAREAYVSKLKDHPALLAWYINDEAKPKSAARVQAMYEMVKKEDPNHPAFNFPLGKPECVFPAAGDIFGRGAYPVNAPSHKKFQIRPLEEVTGNMKTFKDVLPEKGYENTPVWAVLQSFGYGLYWKKKGPWWLHMREPDFNQIRCITYLALIEDVKGVIYYSYQDLWRRPSRQNEDEEHFERRWAGMRLIGREFNVLQNVMLHGEPLKLRRYPHPNPENRVAVGGYAYNGELYVLVASPQEHAQTDHLEIPLPAETGPWRVKGLLDGEVLAETVQNGRKLSIHIPPHGADTIILEPQTAAQTGRE
jgi:hypothetical protein